MAVAAVVGARDVRELPELRRRHEAVRDRDAQHVRVQLHVEAVLQAQRLELVLGDLAGQAAGDLAAELVGAVGDDAAVVVVVLVHGDHLWGSGRRSAMVGPVARMRSRAVSGMIVPVSPWTAIG